MYVGTCVLCTYIRCMHYVVNYYTTNRFVWLNSSYKLNTSSDALAACFFFLLSHYLGISGFFTLMNLSLIAWLNLLWNYSTYNLSGCNCFVFYEFRISSVRLLVWCIRHTSRNVIWFICYLKVSEACVEIVNELFFFFVSYNWKIEIWKTARNSLGRINGDSGCLPS